MLQLTTQINTLFTKRAIKKHFGFQILLRSLLLILPLVFVSTSGFAAEFFVSPSGSTAGDGSRTRPWALATALAHPSTVRGGDTIWLLGGQYVGQFNSRLNGTPGLPIVVRQYPGERAILESADASVYTKILDLNGSWTTFWGFEIRATTPTKSGERASGLNVYGPNIKMINLVIHDTGGIGFWNGSDNSEMYGNLIFYNGYDSDRGHGHSIYSQNKMGTKRIVDNIYFNSFGHGLHIYGSENAYLDNYHIEGNIGFNSGLMSRDGAVTNMLVGGGGFGSNHKYINNYTYFNPGFGSGRGAQLTGCNNFQLKGNVFVGSPVAANISCSNLSMEANMLVGSIQGFSQGTYPNNSYFGSRPNNINPMVYVRPNIYESGRAHVAIYNWTKASSVPVDLSSVLNSGDVFEVRDVQDFFGTPLYTGVYAGTPVTFPMNTTTVWQGIGTPTALPVHTSPEFGSFVVLRKSGSATPPPVPADRTPTLSAGANQTITLPSGVSLMGSVSDPGFPSGPLVLSWSKLSGPGNVSLSSPSTLSTTATFSSAGTYVLQLSANNTKLSGTSTVSVTVLAQPTPTPVPVPVPVPTPVPTPNPIPTPIPSTTPLSKAFKINSGGSGGYVSSGITWLADQYVTGGATQSVVGAIGWAGSNPIFNDQRVGDFTYNIPVRDGTYHVVFNYAELVHKSAGKRVFNVYVNGAIVAGSLDIVARASGGMILVNQGSTVRSKKGFIEIRFESVIDKAILNGLEITPISFDTVTTPSPVPAPIPTTTTTTSTTLPQVPVPTPTPVPVPVPTPILPGVPGVPLSSAFKINAGGGGGYVSSGITWLADQYVTGGTTQFVSGAIGWAGTSPIFNDQRVGDFTYNIPVKSGTYHIVFNYAELVHKAMGKRVFNVYVNGVIVAGSLDIVARSSGGMILVNQGSTVRSKNGFIEIRFESVIDKAILNGLEITPISFD